MTSPRRTAVEHVLTSDNEPIEPHIQAINVSGGGSGDTHAKLHSMSSHIDREKGTDIASAAAITPPIDGDYFHVTGTTKITSIVSRPAGDRILIRIISAGLVIEHKTGTLNLRGNVDIISESNTIAEFISEGSGEWTEIRRSGGQDGLNQSFEVELVAGVPPALVDATSTGTGASGVIATIITAPVVPALVDATATATGTSGITPITITAPAVPAPVVAVSVT